MGTGEGTDNDYVKKKAESSVNAKAEKKKGISLGGGTRQLLQEKKTRRSVKEFRNGGNAIKSRSFWKKGGKKKASRSKEKRAISTSNHRRAPECPA